MKNPAYKLLLLGSLALFLNFCDSSKTDSKDKTTDKTSQKTTDIATPSPESPAKPTDDRLDDRDDAHFDCKEDCEKESERADMSDYDLAREKEKEESGEIVVTSATDAKEPTGLTLKKILTLTPNKVGEEEVFNGYVFKAHLNDFFDAKALEEMNPEVKALREDSETKSLQEINSDRKKMLKLIASPDFLLNTENYKICHFKTDTDTYSLSKDLLKSVKNVDCQKLMKSIPSIIDHTNDSDDFEMQAGDIFLDITYLSDISFSSYSKKHLISKNTGFSKQVFKNLTTPYLYSNGIIYLKNTSIKKDEEKIPTFALLTALTQKFISKYLDDKLGDTPLIPDTELRELYKKKFLFNSSKNMYLLDRYDAIERPLGDFRSPFSPHDNRYQSLFFYQDYFYPKQNIYINTDISPEPGTANIDTKRVTIYMPGALGMEVSGNYHYNGGYITIDFSIDQLNPNNMFFQYAQNSKPLEEGGLLPKKTFNNIHKYLSNTDPGYGKDWVCKKQKKSVVNNPKN